MFHIGKVEKIVLPKGKGVISADSTVQAMIRMWDDNLLLLEVDPKIAKDIREEDFVISDYRPIGTDSPNRKMIVTKIVRGELGRSIWKGFTKEFEKRKAKSESGQGAVPMPMPYIR